MKPHLRTASASPDGARPAPTGSQTAQILTAIMSCPGISLRDRASIAALSIQGKAADALLIAIEHIETMRAKDAEATVELVKMGFPATEDGAKAQAVYDATLAKIAESFR